LTSPTPAELGYRWPAEWEPHAATWLAWPHNRDTWPGKFEPIPAVWLELVATLARFEPVHINAGGAEVMAEARHWLGQLCRGDQRLEVGSRKSEVGEGISDLKSQISDPQSAIPSSTLNPRPSTLNPIALHDIATNDVWERDHGPTFLAPPPGAPPAMIDWGYNAWGGKYPPFDKDDLVPRQVADLLGYRRFEPGIILEGGAVDGNGLGTILTTEQCLLNPNRNPGRSRQEIEGYLRDYLGARHIIWLGEGIVGDDTDGHIDELARFVGPRTVLAALEEDAADENYRPLRDNFDRLRRAVDQDGQALEVLPLPMPRPLHYNNQRLPASYANFYIANGLVIVPQFDDPADSLALDTLRRAFPERQIVGLRAVDLAWGLGAYHCITQQQPK
jgi:agmatine deiminase